MATVGRPKKTSFCEKSSLIATNFFRTLSLVLSKMALRRAPPPKKMEYKPQPESQPELHSSPYVKVVDAARGRDGGEVDAWATAYIRRVRAEHKHALHAGSASPELLPPPTLPPNLTSRQIEIT